MEYNINVECNGGIFNALDVDVNNVESSSMRFQL